MNSNTYKGRVVIILNVNLVVVDFALGFGVKKKQPIILDGIARSDGPFQCQDEMKALLQYKNVLVETERRGLLYFGRVWWGGQDMNKAILDQGLAAPERVAARSSYAPDELPQELPDGL